MSQSQLKVFFVLAFTVSCNAQASTCEEKLKEICLSTVPEDDIFHLPLFKDDNEYLKKNCHGMIMYAGCALHFNETCPTEYRNSSKTFRDAVETIDSICAAYIYYERYEEISACLAKNTDNIMEAGQSLIAEIREFSSHWKQSGNPPLGMLNELGCLFFKFIPEPSVLTFKSLCGNDTAMNSYLNKMTPEYCKFSSYIYPFFERYRNGDYDFNTGIEGDTSFAIHRVPSSWTVISVVIISMTFWSS